MQLPLSFFFLSCFAGIVETVAVDIPLAGSGPGRGKMQSNESIESSQKLKSRSLVLSDCSKGCVSTKKKDALSCFLNCRGKKIHFLKICRSTCKTRVKRRQDRCIEDCKSDGGDGGSGSGGGDISSEPPKPSLKPKGKNPDAPVGICPKIKRPVKCGENEEFFPNQCRASEKGGYTKEDCRRVLVCNKNLEPVECGDNKDWFANQCVANREAEFTRDACVKSDNYMMPPAPLPTNDPKNKKKNNQDPPTTCVKIRAPVNCGFGSKNMKDWYPNQCIASKKGGYTPKDCNRVDIMTNPKKKETVVVCSKIKDPVVCKKTSDEKGEWFPNLCKAKRDGGYIKKQCVDTDEPSTVFAIPEESVSPTARPV